MVYGDQKFLQLSNNANSSELREREREKAVNIKIAKDFQTSKEQSSEFARR